jgi:hypothetical protein
MQGRFCKKVLRLPPSTVKGAAEHKLGKKRKKLKNVLLNCKILM